MPVMVMGAVVVGAAVIDGCGMVDEWCRRINDWSWGVDNGRWRIDDGLLDHDGLGRLSVDNGGAWLLHYDLLRNHGSRLLHDDGCGLVNNRCGIHINRRRCIDALLVNHGGGLERFREQEAGAYSCHDFAGGGPFLVAGVDTRSRCSEKGQRCYCYEGSFHNLCSVGFDADGARLFRRPEEVPH